FVKFLPGVDVGTDQMNSVQIGLRGLPSNYTNIALDGDDVNAAGSAGPTRNTLLQAFSLSNAQRVEIYKVPTPDMPASLARGINRNFSTAITSATNPLRSGLDNPYLTSLVYNVFPVYEHRYAIGSRLDWKVSPVDTLSFSTSGNWLVQDYEQHNFTINAGT